MSAGQGSNGCRRLAVDTLRIQSDWRFDQGSSHRLKTAAVRQLSCFDCLQSLVRVDADYFIRQPRARHYAQILEDPRPFRFFNEPPGVTVDQRRVDWMRRFTRFVNQGELLKNNRARSANPFKLHALDLLRAV